MTARLAVIAALVACGPSPSPSLDAANPPAIDVPPAGGNALGRLCPVAVGGAGTACPADHVCMTVPGIGSTKTGYCSPLCMNSSAICMTGYTGPAGGFPQCALGHDPNATAPDSCAIICDSSAQCPPQTDCLSAPPTAPVAGKLCVAVD